MCSSDLMQANLANALFQAGRFAEAGERFRMMLEREPNNPALLNNYAVTLYRSGDTEAAVRMFRRALEINPDLKDARDGLAVALGQRPDPAAGGLPNRPVYAPRQEPALPGRSTLGPASAPTPAGKSFDPLGIQGR